MIPRTSVWELPRLDNKYLETIWQAYKLGMNQICTHVTDIDQKLVVVSQ